MRPWVVWVLGLGVIGACFAAGRVVSDGPAAPSLAGTIDLTEEQRERIWAIDPENPRNKPFPGPPPLLSGDQKRAVRAAAELARAGSQTRVVSVERMSYREAACGLTSYKVPDIEVWLVALEGPFRYIVHSGVAGMDHEAFSRTINPPSVAYIIDAETFVSQQSFAPWPLPRDPGANCSPD